MTDKMTVLLIKDTKHIVGVVTRIADPEAKLQPKALAGDSVVIRYVGDPAVPGYESEFPIASEKLDVLITDFDKDVIASPRTHIVDDQNKVVVANVLTNVVPAFPSANEVSVTLGAPTPQEAKVLLVITGDDADDYQAVSGKIAAAGMTVTLNIEPLTSLADYQVLAFVQGYEMERLDLVGP